MQSYYELGYQHALEKLGMVDKEAGPLQWAGALGQKAKVVGGAIKSVVSGKGMPLRGPEAAAAQEASARSSRVSKDIAQRTSKAQKAQAAPIAQSKSTPPVKEQAAASTTAAGAKPEQGFLSKHKWPLIGAGALGAAGLGGYAYLKNRDPMGGTGQLPSGYSGRGY